MKIKWLAHSSFLITSEGGKKIITDPYSVGGGINYTSINEFADIVTISHDHGDPLIIKGNGTRDVGSIKIRGIASKHDESEGSKRGKNTIFCFSVDGINSCHLGDLGHSLGDKQIDDIGSVDILFIPVGGYYTIDTSQATAICKFLHPKITIPMHYKTSKCDYPISTVEEFLTDKENVRTLNSSEAEFKKDNLPVKPEILVIKHAL
jgi:L-ascorbate metabolism protein UlaG (beta-lactamase superfamily)